MLHQHIGHSNDGIRGSRARNGFLKSAGSYDAAKATERDYLVCDENGYAELTDRYDIRFDLADYYGGLHCGECLEVFTGGKWKPARMEYSDNWYLVGIRADDLNGLIVRI